MQLVIKFTQAYVNKHANKLFSLSFWPVVSAGGIWDLKLCPARIRIPEIDTEKKTDPSFKGNHEYQEYTGHLTFQTVWTAPSSCPWEKTELSQQARGKKMQWDGAKKPPLTLRERPETCSWPCKLPGKTDGEEEGAKSTRDGLRWDHLWKWLRSQQRFLANQPLFPLGKERWPTFRRLRSSQRTKATTSTLSGAQSHLWQLQKLSLNVPFDPLKFFLKSNFKKKAKIYPFPKENRKITTCSRSLHRLTYLMCRSCIKKCEEVRRDRWK